MDGAWRGAAGQHHFIGNRWLPAAGGGSLPVIDPSDGQPFARIARGDAADVDAAVQAARRAYGESGEGPWGRCSATERGRLLARLSLRVQEAAEELASLESRTTGKPLKQGRSDAAALARYFEYYGGAADKLHGETLPYGTGMTVLTIREPHGVTGHIDIVTGLGHEAGSALAMHAGVDHISFTGSPVTGSRVAQAAAAHHCPVTLELGGKSPQVVFADADLDSAVPVLVSAIMQNAGQTCSAGSRLLVERAIYEEVLGRVGAAIRVLKVGPALEDLDLGPLIRRSQQQRVWDFLSQAQADGIAVAAQGEIVEHAPEGGFYQAPTLLRDVPPAHAIAQQEIFGPVLAAMPFDSEEQAIAMANGTPYGLVAGVWTRDGGRQMRLARRLNCGQVFINNYGAGGGIELPFGGVKSSGYGREKGFEALAGFTRLKTIAIRHG